VDHHSVNGVTAGPGDDLGRRVGELRRLTIMFCDVVESTELSGRWDPETYRYLMGDYRSACQEVIENQFEGSIVQLKGDGILSIFGFPVAHENDAERAVRAALALVRAVHNLSARGTESSSLDVRVGVHHGPLYVDLDEHDVYGLAANVGARLQSIAAPGTVVVSEEVRKLIGGRFEIEAGEPQHVKGLAEPLQPFRVLGERRAPVRRDWLTPLVEREDLLERLRGAWAQVETAGAPGAIALTGESGVGKSRLLAAFIDDPCCAGARIIELHGSPFHTDDGFHPIRRLIEDRCEMDADIDPAVRLERLAGELRSLGLDTSRTLSLMAPLLGIAPSAGYEPVAVEVPKLAELIAEAAGNYITACTAGARAIVVAEDLHWFDAATRGLLETLLDAETDGLMILATSRVAQDAPWQVFELQPLSQAGCLELIDGLQEVDGEQDRLALAARSDGIPLYLEELARAHAASPPGAAEAIPLPGSVPAALYEPLVARLYATPAALPVAATVAAAGQEVDRSLLAATIALPEEDLDVTLRSLLDARILVLAEGRGDRYHFRHELLREVAYELQPPSWRREVHSRLCDNLTREEPGDWRALATHFERATRYEEAAHAYRQTAEAARRRGALEESRSHLAHAIELIHSVPGDHADLEVDLRLQRGFLAMSMEGAGSTDASADYERCLELAAADPEGDAMFSTLTSLWSYYLSRGELERAKDTSTTLRTALAGPRSYYRPQNLAGFGMLEWFAGDFRAAIETLDTATRELAVIGSYGDISPMWFVPIDAKSAMHVYLALARFMNADLAGADASLARAVGISEALDFPQGPWSADYAHWLGSWVWIESGRFDQAKTALHEMLSSSELHGFANWQLVGATQAAALEAVAALRSGSSDVGALAERVAALSGFIAFWEATDLRVFLPFYITVCGALLAASGDPDGAHLRYEQSLKLSSETGMRFYDAETLRRAAHLASGPQERIAGLSEALKLARAQGARPFELRIALDLHELQAEGGDAGLQEAMDAFPRDAMTIDLERARARLSAQR
jgi:class 3 adenylate cyclase/tetratricopeptide (TPR) repeat protein